MEATLRKLRDRLKDREDGFTLVELLVVVVIIGVLVAIAIPMYLNYRQGAADKSAESDVRGAISSLEQYYSENGNVYPDGGENDEAGEALVVGDPELTIAVSPNNFLKLVNRAATAGVPETYVLCGMNKDSTKVFTYDSKKGGSVKANDEWSELADCVAA